LESLPPPDAGARWYVVAHAGDASRMNSMVSAYFFILVVKVSMIVEKAQSKIAHHCSNLISLLDREILAHGTGKEQVYCRCSVLKQLLPIPGKNSDRHAQTATI
jgi:hypothetical protein